MVPFGVRVEHLFESFSVDEGSDRAKRRRRQRIHAHEASLTHQLYVAAGDEGDEVEYPNHKLLTVRPDGMV
jgi:hypothetical protein